MPRNLTKQQKEAAKLNEVYKCILEEMKRLKAIKDWNEVQLAEHLGITDRQWRKWANEGAMLKSSFGSVMLAALRCGIRVEISPPERKHVSFGGEDVN